MFQNEKFMDLCRPEMIEALKASPYDIARDHLYTADELYDTVDFDLPEKTSACYDARVYQHYASTGMLSQDPQELWARHCHDVFLLKALRAFLKNYPKRKVVGIMGWHHLLRTDPYYHKVVRLAKRLTEKGWLVISGGGPGAMEATHLGAWLAGRSDADVDRALQILQKAPSYEDAQWLRCGFEVRREFPRQNTLESLAIPTWFYGHEPACIFATRIAKLFSNSVREDVLIEIPLGGMIFMPGSAGTFSELFLATERDHYLAARYPSPLILFGKDFWTKKTPLLPMIRAMLQNRKFQNLLTMVVDRTEEAADIIEDFDNIYALMLAKKKETPSETSAASLGKI